MRNDERYAVPNFVDFDRIVGMLKDLGRALVRDEPISGSDAVDWIRRIVPYPDTISPLLTGAFSCPVCLNLTIFLAVNFDSVPAIHGATSCHCGATDPDFESFCGCRATTVHGLVVDPDTGTIVQSTPAVCPHDPDGYWQDFDQPHQITCAVCRTPIWCDIPYAIAIASGFRGPQPGPAWPTTNEEEQV